ncbi:hypothetical protein J5X84_34095 [Streptosporangiaceae bacterium NEAU-GS5]|nr:hypothetical protein [Streptosporangiaceae bacterium NEAU-GS5]
MQIFRGRKRFARKLGSLSALAALVTAALVSATALAPPDHPPSQAVALPRPSPYPVPWP